jgi:hypothetical protein
LIGAHWLKEDAAVLSIESGGTDDKTFIEQPIVVNTFDQNKFDQNNTGSNIAVDFSAKPNHKHN